MGFGTRTGKDFNKKQEKKKGSYLRVAWESKVGTLDIFCSALNFAQDGCVDFFARRGVFVFGASRSPFVSFVAFVCVWVGFEPLQYACVL